MSHPTKLDIKAYKESLSRKDKIALDIEANGLQDQIAFIKRATSITNPDNYPNNNYAGNMLSFWEEQLKIVSDEIAERELLGLRNNDTDRIV